MTDSDIQNRSGCKEFVLAHHTKLTDAVTLHGQLLTDMGVRRNYERLIHAGMWAGIVLGTKYLIEKRPSPEDFTPGSFYILLFGYFSFLVVYSAWVIFISKRQQQVFYETRFIRQTIYEDPDELESWGSIARYVKDETTYNFWTGIQDPPAYLRILITAGLLYSSALLYLQANIGNIGGFVHLSMFALLATILIVIGVKALLETRAFLFILTAVVMALLQVLFFPNEYIRSANSSIVALVSVGSLFLAILGILLVIGRYRMPKSGWDQLRS